ncbi:hypothetical protein RND81_10G205200 [Saponaria officinalis]|uniref:Succinate dehydrogenase assembly factor 2, mitochondrial n=1 Tax=Saponaria officinalis TaxID=3572 RepID=A0AAW1I6Z9_SAPOF
MAILRRTSSTLSRLINFTVASRNRSNAFVVPSISNPNLVSKSQVVPATHRLYSTEFDLSDSESKRRTINRLLYRSKQRGLLELDLVLGKWVEDNIDSMDENGIKSLIQVLDLENPDLWRWLSGQEQPPESLIGNPVFTAIKEKVASNLNSYAAPETRATPGQPWVRGWDDIKKNQYSPVSGNQ